MNTLKNPNPLTPEARYEIFLSAGLEKFKKDLNEFFNRYEGLLMKPTFYISFILELKNFLASYFARIDEEIKFDCYREGDNGVVIVLPFGSVHSITLRLQIIHSGHTTYPMI